MAQSVAANADGIESKDDTQQVPPSPVYRRPKDDPAPSPNEVGIQMILPEVEDSDAGDAEKKGDGDEDDADDYIYDTDTKEGAAIDKFRDITSEDQYIAAKYLQPVQWSVQLALNAYWERSAAERMADTGAGDNVLIYSHGVSFWYWPRGNGQDRASCRYVAPRYANLKEEVMATGYVNAKAWRGVLAQCETLIETDKLKSMRTNGNDEDREAYGIEDGSSMTLQHLLAIRLYTDFTSLGGIFCGAFRKQNAHEIEHSIMRRNQRIAIWARLLIEAIRCFGRMYGPTHKFYRGVSGEFMFKRFIATFNGPVSTSTDVCYYVLWLCVILCYLVKVSVATMFAVGGLVMELRSHLDLNPGLDCSLFGSQFPGAEKEVLFFGANLQLRSIRHAVDGKWLSYKQPMEKIQAVKRIAQGGIEWANTNNLKDIMSILLPELYGHVQPSANFTTEYVRKLIDLHMKAENLPDVIEYDFVDLLQSYEWVKTIFVKGNDIPNLHNMCNLFKNVKRFRLRMPDRVTMNKQFCEALMEEMLQINNLGQVQIELEWGKHSSKDVDKIAATLQRCAEKSEHIELETMVSDVVGQPKSIKIMPSKKDEKKEEEMDKGMEGNDEHIGDPPPFAIIYDSITLSFIEFFAFHGDPYWKYEPRNYKESDPVLGSRRDVSEKATTWPEV